MWSMAGMDGQWLPVKQSSSLLLQFMWLPKNVNAVLLILSAPFAQEMQDYGSGGSTWDG